MRSELACRSAGVDPFCPVAPRVSHVSGALSQKKSGSRGANVPLPQEFSVSALGCRWQKVKPQIIVVTSLGYAREENGRAGTEGKTARQSTIDTSGRICARRNGAHPRRETRGA